MSLRTDLPFAMVPLWVLEMRLSDKALRLYAVLAGHADRQTHESRVKRKTLAAEMRCTVATVYRAKAELIERGCVSVERRTADNGQDVANGYVVHLIPPENRGDAQVRTSSRVRPGGHHPCVP